MLDKILSNLYALDIRVKICISILVIINFIFLPDLFVPSLTHSIFIEYVSYWIELNTNNIFRACFWSIVFLFIFGFFFKSINDFISTISNNRWFSIFSIGITEFLLLYYFKNDWKDFFQHINNQNNHTWLGPFFTMLVASPVAFGIWIFRNEDKKRDQKHAEEAIRQDDFHKIEVWATNFPQISDEPENNSSIHKNSDKGTLQIAAIFQLLPFLKGEYGDRFIRPSMEIFLALLSSWKLIEEIEQDPKKAREFIQSNKPNYINALYTIIIEEHVFFRSFHKEYKIKYYSKYKNSDEDWIPLKYADLKGINLSEKNLNEINLYGASLQYAYLSNTNFKGANLKFTNLSHTHLRLSNFQKAEFDETYFSHANLVKANFVGNLNLSRSNFNKASLVNADFKGANLRGSHFGSDYKKKLNEPTNIPIIEARYFPIKFCESKLDNALFSDAVLKGSSFIEANLKGAKFYGAFLQSATFNDFNLGELIFTYRDFTRWIDEGVNFTGCYVYNNFDIVKLSDLHAAGIEIRKIIH